MKNALLVLIVAMVALSAGCAQSQPQAPPAPPAAAPPAPAAPPAQPAAQPMAPAENATPAPAAAPPDDTCTLQFQKDTSNIYYVMVKTASAKEVSVTCPNGKAGQRQGELYFCSQLDIPSPAIAYLGGAECARSQFSKPSSGSPPGGQQCKVLLSPPRITAGQTSGVSVTGYVSQEKSRISYNCGDREITESASVGMFDTGKICTFGAPGTVEISAKINGVECGSALLSVFASQRDCAVFGSEFRMSNGKYNYTAKVSARGYSGTDELHYSCYDTPFGIRASTIKSPTDFITAIECSSASGPLSQNVKVTMGGDACGELVVAK